MRTLDAWFPGWTCGCLDSYCFRAVYFVGREEILAILHYERLKYRLLSLIMH